MEHRALNMRNVSPGKRLRISHNLISHNASTVVEGATKKAHSSHVLFSQFSRISADWFRGSLPFDKPWNKNVFFYIFQRETRNHFFYCHIWRMVDVVIAAMLLLDVITLVHRTLGLLLEILGEEVTNWSSWCFMIRTLTPIQRSTCTRRSSSIIDTCL